MIPSMSNNSKCMWIHAGYTHIYVYASINISWCSILSIAKLQNFCTLPQKRNGRAFLNKSLQPYSSGSVIWNHWTTTMPFRDYFPNIHPHFSDISTWGHDQIYPDRDVPGNQTWKAMWRVPKIWVPRNHPFIDHHSIKYGF
jgi:hypothetical protein